MWRSNVRWGRIVPSGRNSKFDNEPMMPLSARLGYKFSDTLVARLEGFNILNEKSHQIDYYYASRLPNEASAVSNIHFHPAEPLSLRLGATVYF